jgi:hypothetical protein
MHEAAECAHGEMHVLVQQLVVAYLAHVARRRGVVIYLQPVRVLV